MNTSERQLATVRFPRLKIWMFALQSIGLSPLALALWLIMAIVPLFIRDEFILRLMISSLLIGAQAIAFDFTVGQINVVNFGWAAFVGLGAYSSGLLALHLGVSPWLGLLFGSVVSGILGFITGILTLRLRGIYAAVMAWFVGLTLQSLFIVNVGITRGNMGLIVPLFLGTSSQRDYFYILLPIAFVTYITLRAITNSHVGLAFRAIGQNLEAARASGVNPTTYRVLNFTVGCTFAGLIGAFYAHFIGVLTPSIMSTAQTTEVLAIAYIGGRGSIWGPLLSAWLIVPVFQFLKPLFEIRLIIYGIFLGLTMIFYPGGLASLIQMIPKAMSRLIGGKK